MKVLLANGSAYPTIGGVETSLRYIGRELKSLGHDVKIFSLQNSPREPLQMEHEGIEIVRVPYKHIKWPHLRLYNRVKTTGEGVRRIIDEFQPDVVWSRSAPIGLGIRRSGYKGPLVQIFSTNARMNARGLYLETAGFSLFRRLRQALLWPLGYFPQYFIERELVRQCISVSFSENMKRQILAAYPNEIDVCHVVAPGVDSTVFSPENGFRYVTEIERKFKLKQNEPLVLYVGRLSTAKQIPILIDAISLIKSKAKLLLVGSGNDETSLKRYAERCGISDRIVWAGSHHEMLPGFYAISRVCVLPTVVESFGQVYLESMSSGTPVIGFAGDGLNVLTATEEIVEDGLTGVIVKHVNAKELASTIDFICEMSESSYSAMSEYSREYTCLKYSWQNTVAHLLDLCSE